MSPTMTKSQSLANIIALAAVLVATATLFVSHDAVEVSERQHALAMQQVDPVHQIEDALAELDSDFRRGKANLSNLYDRYQAEHLSCDARDVMQRIFECLHTQSGGSTASRDVCTTPMHLLKLEFYSVARNITPDSELPPCV